MPEHPWARAGLHIRSRADRTGQYLLPIPLPRPLQPLRPKKKPPAFEDELEDILKYLQRLLMLANGPLTDWPGSVRYLALRTKCPQSLILFFIRKGWIGTVDGIWVAFDNQVFPPEDRHLPSRKGGD